MGICSSRFVRRLGFALPLLLAAVLLSPLAAHATEGIEGDIPGTYLDGPNGSNYTEVSGDLSVDHVQGYAESDVYCVWFAAGEVVDFTLHADNTATDFGLRLYGPEALTIDDEDELISIADPHHFLSGTREDPAALTGVDIPRTGPYFIRVFTWLDGTQDGGAGQYRLTIDVTRPLTQIQLQGPSVLDWRQYGEITGTVHSRQDELVSGYVELSACEDGRFFEPMATVYTPDGNFSFEILDHKATTQYSVRYLGNELLNPSSATITIKGRAFLTKPVADRKAYKTYELSGLLGSWHLSAPAKVRLYMWRYVSGHWRSYGYKTVSVGEHSVYGLYALRYKFPYTGKWRLQAYHSDANHVTTKTAYTYLTVK